MISFAYIEEEKHRESLWATKHSTNCMPSDSTIASFNRFIPGQLHLNESPFQEQHPVNESPLQEQHPTLYFQAKSPQTNSASQSSNTPLSIYIAHTQNDFRFIQKVEEILRTIAYQERNINYQFGEIDPDVRWKTIRHNYLASVDLILLLVTSSFVSTDYCYSEQLKLAILRHNEERSYIIPILLQACLWDGTPFANLHTITPHNRKAVDEWTKSGRAFKEIGNDIRNAVRCIRKGR